MTRKEATFKARTMAKESVTNFFEREGVENFNMTISLIKQELSNAFKRYFAHYCSERKTFVVMSLEHRIYE